MKWTQQIIEKKNDKEIFSTYFYFIKLTLINKNIFRFIKVLFECT